MYKFDKQLANCLFKPKNKAPKKAVIHLKTSMYKTRLIRER